MILVYNETRHPWIIKELPEKKTIRIMKHNERTLATKKDANDSTQDKLEKHGTLGILAYANAVDDCTEFANNLSLATAMTSFAEVSKRQVSVSFNRKELRPVITPDGQERTIILLSLPINYRKLISFTSRGVQLLRKSCLRGEFSACIAVTKYHRMQMTIEFLSRKTNTVDVLTITSTTGALPIITKTTRPATEEDLKVAEQGYTPTDYRPLRLTNLIFVKKDKMHLLPKLSREQHTIIQLTGDEEQLKSVIKTTRNKNFRAVTYFGGASSTEELSTELAEETGQVLNTLKKNFAHVNEFYADKVVKNIKS